MYWERGEEQNREEGEMAQKKVGGREIGVKSREEREKEKLGVGRIKLDGPGWGNQKVGRREKLAQKVGRREIYSPVPAPSWETSTS